MNNEHIIIENIKKNDIITIDLPQCATGRVITIKNNSNATIRIGGTRQTLNFGEKYKSPNKQMKPT